MQVEAATSWIASTANFLRTQNYRHSRFESFAAAVSHAIRRLAALREQCCRRYSGPKLRFGAVMLNVETPGCGMNISRQLPGPSVNIHGWVT